MDDNVKELRRVIVTGATGLIGVALCRRLRERGWAPVIFSRDPKAARRRLPDAAATVAWQPQETGDWARHVDGAAAVVSLAGAPLFGQRWTARYKQTILDSRVVGTRGLLRAMAQATVKPRVFVSASAIGYYGWRDDTPLDESAPPGDDFLARVCQAWEAEARRAEVMGVRTAILRIGIVLDATGGALPLLSLPMRLFVGGPILPGDQWVSWLHMEDMVETLLLSLEDERARGPLNIVAPDPRRQRDFSRALGQALGRPAWLPIPRLALRVALGEFADTLITGQRVVPARLADLGYRFRFPTLEGALADLLAPQPTRPSA